MKATPATHPIIAQAIQFLGRPYRAGLLDGHGPEKLIVDLQAFDCVTFVETALAFTLCGPSDTPTKLPRNFQKNLKRLRYRQGKIRGFSSRLHYFTNWLDDNSEKKILVNITRELGGRPFRKRINFMTAHRDQYAGLKSPTATAAMRCVESRLSKKTCYRILADGWAQAEKHICNGDILVFCSDLPGLDVAHTGLALRKNGRVYLLHASSREGAVGISAQTLLAYLKSHKNFNGLMVARLIPA